MNVVMFYHSLISDWNHGNAHFLRGIATELINRNHKIKIYEPADSWSYQNLVSEFGESILDEFHKYYPQLNSIRYDISSMNPDNILKGADLVLVHEWNDPLLVNMIGEHHKKNSGYVLLFHDTHHRLITKKEEMKKYNLKNYDGVLAFGKVLENEYIKSKLVNKSWTWHEAADVKIFHPGDKKKIIGDIIWIGNWGDNERSEELNEFLIAPVRKLNLKCKVYGVRYPQHALDLLKKAGIEYGGWLPNYKVPEVFDQYRFTVHIPRRPYVKSLPGIPTIRPFEALACGIPLIIANWTDSEKLFSSKDFLLVKDGSEMIKAMKEILYNKKLAESLSVEGLLSIHQRHTCSHRADELMRIYDKIKFSEKEMV